MNAALVRRQAALAGVALVAALIALALARLGDSDGSEPVAPLNVPRWQEAVASSYGPGRYGQQTACGVELAPETRGLAHPVLPCGVDILVFFQGKTARAEVLDRGPQGGGAEFELTEALAQDLGLSGTQQIRWRFAD
jgi:rare lipoprotein A (peptidoglycan hydrolase)